MQEQKLKILFFGDIVGKAGRYAVRDFLADKSSDIDFVVANVENASHGFGLTEKNYNELSEYGIDCMTSGNHIWDKKEILNYIDDAERLIRPINYPEAQGRGYGIFETPKGKIAVINALGRNFMPVFDSPRYPIEKVVETVKQETKVILIDFHAEASAEKMCYAKYFSQFGVSALIGTHTHVQTADERIFDGQTAYITDVGYCGDYESIIGMDYESSLSHILTMLPSRFEVANSGSAVINAVTVTVDAETGKAEEINRINIKTVLQE
ncbi:MAG: TIGR00282 family metallophosphoesterase [Candidatus Gastranaerophilales bacterium]|nr:TIGR00282 family metallophosphoesterase [Candidatus Gastranaerophilales bacterium]